MGSKWRKVKMALGQNLCVYVPKTLDEEEDSTPSDSTHRLSNSALLSQATLTPSPKGFRLSKSLSESSKQACSICLTKMKYGGGQAIFTAECSHTFHFHCITSNVKHGNHVCPVCRAKWKEVPFQVPPPPPPVHWPQNNPVVRRPPPPRRDRRIVHHMPEPDVYDDDESIDLQPTFPKITSSESTKTIEVKTFLEVSAALRSKSYENFTVLVNLKASSAVKASKPNLVNLSQLSQTRRAPVDLVTVLDVSGSMAGTKLALLKRAMGFLIQSLSSNDRLSVIAFSSTARRLFPLCKMSDIGRQQALQAVNSLVANGGTNIAEGLRKSAKIMEDRRVKNPVSSIILLSDGQDTYTVNSSSTPNYQLLLPDSRFHIPVHAFGFGADHDASSMHSISELSGGTFSFIETEAVIQDAFAQCIGGLLSVVVQELQLRAECIHPNIRINSLKAGSYLNRVMVDRRVGVVEVGDLYADEERDFLFSVNIPAEFSRNETMLLKVKCVYKDPLTKEMVTVEGEEVRISRPETDGELVASIEVDKQRNRIQAAEAMTKAKSIAEHGDLAQAVTILENFRKLLSESISAKSHDSLCIALDAEMKEMQERMTSKHVYESSGRAYILSGLSSHSWQRATARGDSIDGSSVFRAYQTPSMAEMLTRSQATVLGSPSAQRPIQSLRSFGSQPYPR